MNGRALLVWTTTRWPSVVPMTGTAAHSTGDEQLIPSLRRFMNMQIQSD